jgi:hypothetical protein
MLSFALDLFVDFEIVEPAIAVAHNLVAVRKKSLRQLRVLFKRPDHAENADLYPETPEDPQQAPAPAAGPIFKYRLNCWVSRPLIRR